MQHELTQHRRPTPEQPEQNICDTCGAPVRLRRPKQRIASYLFFVASFVAFLTVTSLYKITLIVNALWFAVQLAFGIWAALDRVHNARLVFYCRSCNSSLRS